VVYEETQDEDKKSEEADEVRIPPGLEEKQTQILNHLIPEQHFTQPQPRFTEASLVQTLEENGIGRPSTYAPYFLQSLIVDMWFEKQNASFQPKLGSWSMTCW